MTDAETYQALIGAANFLAIRSAENAKGKCFLSTVEFAAACVLANAANLQLLRWKVRDDPDYCEHWAIKVSEHDVIDLTRVQVDGDITALHKINSYPQNYRVMNCYPVADVLNWCAFNWNSHTASSDGRALRSFRWDLFRYDFRNVPLGQKLAIVGDGLGELMRFAIHALLERILHKLETRRALLSERMRHY